MANKYYNKEKKREAVRKYRKTRQHPCLVCGKLVDFRATYCHKHALAGSRHYHWKGGRINHRGYILIQKPEHPRANRNGYIWEHLIIWEEDNNKQLPKGWVIHHINGVKNDNRINNLIAMPNKKHKNLIAVKERKIQELEARLKNQHQLI